MKLVRYKKTKTYVLGVMHDDKGGTYFTVENATSLIPAATYKVSQTYSPKFNAVRPLIYGTLAVTEARGIRIHEGNSYADSIGCICVGNYCDLTTGKLQGSKKALEQLMKNCGDSLVITSFLE